MATFNGRLYDRRFITRYNNLSSVYADILPNDIKEAVLWSEFIVANVPVVASALEKMSSVSITNFQYMTSDLSEMGESDSRSWKTIIEEDIDMEVKLQEIGFNYMTSGNVFISVFFPIVRTMHCTTCGEANTKVNFDRSQKLKPILETIYYEKDTNKRTMKGKTNPKKKYYTKKELCFKGTCPSCRKETLFYPEDIETKNTKKVNIISWPINNINLVSDHITGITTYHYKLPGAERKMIMSGYIDMAFNQPKDIIISAIENTGVIFDEDKIIHVRRKKMNGTSSGWGMPILTPAIPEMISLLLLRRSQERILTDMIFPLRGLTPKTSTQEGQPMYNFMSGSDLGTKIENVLKRHKVNPTDPQYFPIPLEGMTLFGEGKALNLSQEIDAISTMIMNSIGVPVEFVKGGLGYNSSGASIRVLENQLMRLTSSMEKVVNFVAEKIAHQINKKPVRIKITPFRIMDDLQEKQTILSLYQNGKISDHTVSALFNYEADVEARKLTEEQKKAIKTQKELEEYQQQLSQNLEEKAKTEAMLNNSSTEQVNQQAIMQEADSVAQQLAQLDQTRKRSELDRLQKENWLLYVAVKDRMEFNERKDITALKSEAQQDGAQ